MPALHRAIALAEMDHVAVRVAEHLDFDMPRIDDGALQEQAIVAEGVLGFRARGPQRSGERVSLRDEPHAASATAGSRLHHHGKSEACGFLRKPRVGLVLILIAGHAGHAGGNHAVFGFRFVAHHADRLRRRPDEDQARIGAGLREGGVL